MFGNILECVVCNAFEGPLRTTGPFYTGAPRHPQNLNLISIPKVGNSFFHIMDMEHLT